MTRKRRRKKTELIVSKSQTIPPSFLAMSTEGGV
jgi:hypothetical protein